MAIKMIATDLDGTLMSCDHMTVSEKTKTALLRAHKQGVKIAIATGRTLASTKNATEQAPFVDYVIYSNGAGVYDCAGGRVLCSQNLQTDTAVKIIDFIEKYPVFYDVYKGGRQHTRHGVIKYYTSTELPQAYLDEYMSTTVLHGSICDFVKDGGVEKVNVFSYDNKYVAAFDKFLKSCENIDFACPFDGSVEITHALANKGEALKNLCAEEGILNSEVMAFGDSENDISMLSFAGYSFAMGNACPECKAAAKYETLSNVQDGIAAAVNAYIFNEKQGAAG